MGFKLVVSLVVVPGRILTTLFISDRAIIQYFCEEIRRVDRVISCRKRNKFLGFLLLDPQISDGQMPDLA